MSSITHSTNAKYFLFSTLLALPKEIEYSCQQNSHLLYNSFNPIQNCLQWFLNNMPIAKAKIHIIISIIQILTWQNTPNAHKHMAWLSTINAWRHLQNFFRYPKRWNMQSNYIDIPSTHPLRFVSYPPKAD